MLFFVCLLACALHLQRTPLSVLTEAEGRAVAELVTELIFIHHSLSVIKHPLPCIPSPQQFARILSQRATEGLYVTLKQINRQTS